MILGAIVGDTIGSCYEFHNVKTTEFDLFTRWTAFTDDTVMTLAVAEALMDADQGAQPISYALVESMRRLGRRYPDAGYGGQFARWLAERGAHPRPYGSWGNGSAMRVSPVAWAFDSLELVEYVAAETAKVTHNAPEGICGAQATAACIFMARTGAANDQIREYVRGRFGYALDFTLDDIRPGYIFDVSCQGSVPQAIEAFLEGGDFEDTVRKAISIGGDSDTIAAIAGAIAQGRYGVPCELEQEVRARLTADLIEINDLFCASYNVGLQEGGLDG